jgi:hypothetical protein
MRWFGKIPRHCRSCEKRFYVMIDEITEELPQSESLENR